MRYIYHRGYSSRRYDKVDICINNNKLMYIKHKKLINITLGMKYINDKAKKINQKVLYLCLR